MTQFGKKGARSTISIGGGVLDARPWSVYVCPFCAFTEQNAKDGLDHLEEQDKIFYLQHLKMDHGLIP